ncbi:ABC transporter permease [Mangrovicella endophytica]|uniref:ABC transporter permease n=1 Tax=Mangrovicella endophytica TaxID=2066697 RepID=UPI0018E474E9|nr:ABC transporter permease [Mangrovicella endophytica]
MLRPVLTRLLGLVLTLLAISAAVFLVMSVLPGDPAAIMLGTSARPDTLAALRSELGLDRPLPLRYAAWLTGLLTGDLGRSVTYGVPVAKLVLAGAAVTLPLAAMAILISLLLGLPLGVAAAARRGSAVDAGVSLFAQLGIATPNFWIGLLLILVFAATLGWMPSGGFPGWQAGAAPALTALLMPSIALALPQAAVLARVTRTATLEVLGEDFVRTARAKGLSRRQALWRHAVPNALLPVITIIGLQFTFLVAGAVLVENVFGLPGLGRLAMQALAQRDVTVMQVVVLLFATLAIVVNVLVDLAYLALDPRLRNAA